MSKFTKKVPENQREQGRPAFEDLPELVQELRADISDLMEAFTAVSRHWRPYQQTMDMDSQRMESDTSMHNDKMSLEREKMENQLEMKKIDERIAKENKNQYDVKKKKETAEKNSKKKKK